MVDGQPKSVRFSADKVSAVCVAGAGDLIFSTTSGVVYSMGRYVTENTYDHVVRGYAHKRKETQLTAEDGGQWIAYLSSGRRRQMV